MRKLPGLLALAAFGVLALALLLDAATESPAERAAMTAWAAGAKDRALVAQLLLSGLAAIGLALAAGLAALIIRAVWLRTATIRPDRRGLYPLVQDKRGGWISYNEPGVQHMAALPMRPTAALARALLAGPGPARPAQVIDAQPEIVQRPWNGAVDLINRPHTILLGKTGSGKSTAGYAIADAIRRQYDARFLIGEPGGVSWGQQCAASDVRAIGEMLVSAEEEMRARQARLVGEDVQHITELHSPPPFLVLLLEELEDTLDSLRLISQVEARRAMVALRNIAREGRKPGVCLLGITQFGKSDVLDTHIRNNMGAVYCFLNWPHVGQMLRLPSAVRLDRLPVGQAYSYHDAALVPFPLADRPMLASGTVRSTGTGPNPVSEPVPYPVPGTVPVRVPMPTTLDEPTTEAQRQAVIECWQRHRTIKGTQRELFPGQELGGHWFYWIREIVTRRNDYDSSTP